MHVETLQGNVFRETDKEESRKAYSSLTEELVLFEERKC